MTQEDIVKEETWEDKDIKGEEEAQKSGMKHYSLWLFKLLGNLT